MINKKDVGVNRAEATRAGL